MEHDNTEFIRTATDLFGPHWRSVLVRAGVVSPKKADDIALGRTRPGGALEAILETLMAIRPKDWPARWDAAMNPPKPAKPERGLKRGPARGAVRRLIQGEGGE